jgi:hypothetical protein
VTYATSSRRWTWYVQVEGVEHKGKEATADDAARKRDACLRFHNLAGENDGRCAFFRVRGGKEVRNLQQTPRCQSAVTKAGVKAGKWPSPSDVPCADCGDTEDEHTYEVVPDGEGGETRVCRCGRWCVSSRLHGAQRLHGACSGPLTRPPAARRG